MPRGGLHYLFESLVFVQYKEYVASPTLTLAGWIAACAAAVRTVMALRYRPPFVVAVAPKLSGRREIVTFVATISARNTRTSVETPVASAPPSAELPPLSPAELDAYFRGGDPEADACEGLLCAAVRARSAIDLAIAEGLHALRQGDRLAELGCHLDDYAREVLDLGRRAAEGLARLGREVRARPLLAAALRAGRVRLRAAQTILPVADGPAEATWVELAQILTVRELEVRVRQATGGASNDDDEGWARLGASIQPDERAVLDAALAVAAQLQPGASRGERLEAIAQEFQGAYPTEAEASWAGGALRPVRPGGERREALEAETERWAALPAVAALPARAARFDEMTTAHEVDVELRKLARLRSQWDDLVAWCAHAVRRSGLYRMLGFASFRHYCDERLGVSARAIEQRAAVEQRRWASPALREARRQGVSFEKLRLLSRLPEDEIAAWTPRALGLTCIALQRELEGRAERQMRAQGRVAFVVPLRVGALVAAAIEEVCRRAGQMLPLGTCLTILAAHFVETWRGVLRSSSRSRKVRERDQGHCRVPGCSHRASDAHHVLFRSRGGGDGLENQIAACAFHHLRCIHGGHLRVVGRAPEGLSWYLHGAPWAGPQGADRPTAREGRIVA